MIRLPMITLSLRLGGQLLILTLSKTNYAGYSSHVIRYFVELQVLGLGLGVDFVFPLSQEEEQQEQEAPPPKPTRWEKKVLNLALT